MNEAYDNTSITRTASGYIEVIEMGQIDSSLTAAQAVVGPALDAVMDPDYDLTVAQAMTHGADGVPANCQMLVDAWSTFGGATLTRGQWNADAQNGNKGTSEFKLHGTVAVFTATRLSLTYRTAAPSVTMR